MSKLLIFTLTAYAVLFLAALLLHNTIMFPVPPSSYEDSDDLIKLTLSSGSRISVLHMQNPSAEYTLLYSHGNGEDLGRIRERMEAFYKRGFSIIAYDYPGYGTSEGKPSEESANEAITTVYRYLVNDLKVRDTKIILYGFSLGSGPTVELASKENVRGVVLQAPFTTAFRVITQVPILPFDRFENIKKIKEVRAPILITHGKRDMVVPIWHGKKLFKQANKPKSAFWVEKADHNRFHDLAGDAYWKHLKAFVQTL